jgi:DNA-binding CsgD family transcriptional regulator
LAIGDSLLQVAADVARESAEARALASLLPWLGLVCVKMSPPCAPEGAAGPWLDVRQQLASQWCLTARQEQVALLMVLGESNKHIAAKLQVSERTVELHAHAVLSRAQLPNRTALAAHFFNAK